MGHLNSGRREGDGEKVRTDPETLERRTNRARWKWLPRKGKRGVNDGQVPSLGN